MPARRSSRTGCSPLRWVDFLGWALPGAEVALALLLLLGLFTRWAALATALLMIGFIVGISSVWIRGYSIDCGCFGGGGDISEDGKTWRYASEIGRDVIFTAMAAWLVVWPRTKLSLDWPGPYRRRPARQHRCQHRRRRALRCRRHRREHRMSQPKKTSQKTTRERAAEAKAKADAEARRRDNRNRLIGGVIVVALIVLIFGGVWFSKKDSGSSAAPDSSAALPAGVDPSDLWRAVRHRHRGGPAAAALGGLPVPGVQAARGHERQGHHRPGDRRHDPARCGARRRSSTST